MSVCVCVCVDLCKSYHAAFLIQRLGMHECYMYCAHIQYVSGPKEEGIVPPVAPLQF